MRGVLALHGGGEYVRGDEAAMDALVVAALDAAKLEGADVVPRIVLVPTAAARQRPETAAAHGERSFAVAADRAGIEIDIGVARVLSRRDAADPRLVVALESAHLVHFPGGDPDLIPEVLRDTAAWAAIVGAHDAGGVIAGASAGAMALAERCWTAGGLVAGLGLLPAFAVLPHYAPGRLASWRGTRPAGATDVPPALDWLGLDEQTLAIGRPGEPWRVAGRGHVHVVPANGARPVSAGAGETVRIG